MVAYVLPRTREPLVPVHDSMARCVGERIQRRGEIVVVCLVIVIVWGLLTLPIIFYHLRRYQVGMVALQLLYCAGRNDYNRTRPEIRSSRK